MLEIEQKYKDIFNSYGGKRIRLVFYKDNYRALYPSETLYPSEQLYPSEMDKDSIAFEITDDMVHSDTLTITESLCSEENLDFGACESAQMEIAVSNPPQSISGKEFVLIESFSDYDLIRGIYIVDSTPREGDRNTRRIIAYDRMVRFNNDVSGWYNTLKFPMTLKEFRDSLCAFVNVPQDSQSILINDEMVIEKTIEPESLNGRDVLRYICQINGVFGNINALGELRYISVPGKSSITDTVTIYKSVESEEYTVPDIDTIKIQNESGDIGGVSTGGDDMNTYIIEGNFLVYDKNTSQKNEIADKILSLASGLEYRPATIEMNGAPWYEMGDRIRVKTSDGDIDTIIMRRTSKGIQGVMDTIESTGTQELKRVFNVRSQFLEAKGKTAILKRTVEEVSNELRDFEDDTASKFVQTSKEIKAEVTRAKEAEASLSIKADQIESRVTQKITDETNRATTAESKITQRADKIELSVTQEIKDRKDGEAKLSSTITQTATQIRSEVKNVTDGLSSTITQTDQRITQEITNRQNADSSLSSKIDQTAQSITLQVNGKVSKGDVTSQLNSELRITGNSIALTTGHFTVNSKNLSLDSSGNANFSGRITGGSININNIFKVDSSGNTSITGNHFSWSATNSSLSSTGKLTCKSADISGKITATSGQIGSWTIDANGLVGDRGATRGATISGGHIEGATLDVADGILQVEDGYANSSAIVRLGGFGCSDEYGRSIFQSSDEMTGMSGDTGQSGGLYLWAGYRSSGDYAFVVNNDDETRIHGSLHVSGNIYLNGTAISTGGGGGGGGSISGSVSSLKVGYDYNDEWGADWLEIYPKNKPNTNDYPQYDGMDYLYVYLERHYKD